MFSLSRRGTQRIGKKLATSLTALVLSISSFGGMALAAEPADSDAPVVTLASHVSGSAITNTTLLSGTITDATGVDHANAIFRSGAGNVIANVPLAIAGETWQLQLTKTLVPVNLADSSTSLTVRAVDTAVSANQSLTALGVFRLTVPDLEVFQHVTELLAGLDQAVCPLSGVLRDSGPVTVFGPNNEALQSLPVAELAALTANPEQLCYVVSGHVHLGEVVATADVTAPVQLPTEAPSTMPLDVAPASPTGVSVNGTPVVNSDNQLTNGVLHVISSLLQPKSTEVDIADVTTTLSSPELVGTVKDTTATVMLRIDGTSYTVTNKGDGTWTLPAGVVGLDPHKADTLFTVVAISGSGKLLGLTMRSNVLHFDAGKGGGVAGDATSTTSQVTSTTVSVGPAVATLVCAVSGCDQGVASAPQADTATSSTSTNTPSVPTPAAAAQPEKAAEQAKKSSQWYWWLIGIVTLAALYYVLGGSPAAPSGE